MNLLFITLVLLLALLAIKLSNRSGIPALLLFLVLGMLFNAVGIEFNDFEMADKISSLSLMVIMFYGGFGTNWSMGKPVAKQSIVLASLGVVLTALITGLFCYKVLGFNFYEAMLLGSVVGSTDYASVSNILVSKNLNLKYSTAPLLEIESGSNDPTAYTMTMVFLSILLGSEISVPVLIIKQVLFGLVVGFGVGHLFIEVIRFFKLSEDGLFSVFIAAIMFGTYGICDKIGGNGYLALYILGIYIGNKEYKGKRDVVFFYDGISNLVQIALFFLLGLLSDINGIFNALPYGFIIMMFMFIIARPISIFGLLAPFKPKLNQNILISIAGIRGAAAIAFAIMAVNSGVELGIDLFHIVFVVCLFSSLIQGSIMPYATRKLDMFEPNDTVLRNFNYYQDKSNIGFVKTHIGEGSPLIGKRIMDLDLTFPVIVAKIVRDNKTIVPSGKTEIREGDTIVLGAEAYFDTSGEDLIEIKLSPEHRWTKKTVKDIEGEAHKLLIMLQKPSREILVPNGDTVLEEGDRIVMLKEKSSGINPN